MKSKHRYNHRNSSLASAVAIALLGSSALAQAQQLVLEEVIVTAQKRVESLQDVPISITAVSGERIDTHPVHAQCHHQ
jgi:iron complex outermembrane receptor protein